MPSPATLNDNLGKNRQHSSAPGDGHNSLNRQTSLPQCFLQRVDGVSVSPYREAFSSTPDTSESAPQVEIQPFPTDILSEEILHIILYHVLAEPDFGKNGRWSSRDQASRDKAQFAKAHKKWASLHRKFCLIHRSWTPFVLRSLYRSPRLTSKFAIQRLHDCLAHPGTLWGVEIDEENGKVVGGAVGDRRYFVRHLGFHIGTGREGSMDWIKYSGEWISFWATSLHDAFFD
ncbi:hypothetical protein QFC20_002333 [Naganishia adeliensis]|uniref:Uncharacterized protein n=1 Tax=Naganishia adeliensis TaxID=92952 RepID=A0ACC2WM67_9TREE|nr:hypothetical protein QFC20_002333 [Naganishia adeliensis]